MAENKRIILGLGHKARQGKDTAADYLMKNYNCRVIHFADALYDECRKGNILYREDPSAFFIKPLNEDYFILNDPDDSIIDWIKKNGSREEGLQHSADYVYRGMIEKDGTLLQFWGTEFRRRNFGWDYWVDIVRELVESNPDIDYVISDARFKNESQMIKEMGGEVWKIDRVGYLAQDRDPNHTSEIDLDGWEFDKIILNNGSISDLWEKVDREFRKLKGLSDE
ncbi:hypothetical protein ACFL7D_10625 [candidate division KSB1 bacterium]